MSDPVGFKALTDTLASALDGQYDSRRLGKTKYALSDADLAAFRCSVQDSVAVLFSQRPSLLTEQCDLERRKGVRHPTPAWEPITALCSILKHQERC